MVVDQHIDRIAGMRTVDLRDIDPVRRAGKPHRIDVIDLQRGEFAAGIFHRAHHQRIVHAGVVELRSDRREVERVASWLELTPSEEAIARAVAHVQPRHVEESFPRWRRAFRR